MSSIKCSFTCICGIFWPLNPSTTTVYARSAFYPSLHFTLSLQSAFYTQSAVYPWSAVCSPQSTFYTDRFCILSNGLDYPLEKKCHPFERLWLSVRKRIVIPSNGSGYPGVREKLSSFRTTRAIRWKKLSSFRTARAIRSKKSSSV